jgi:hypothetical protein
LILLGKHLIVIVVLYRTKFVYGEQKHSGLWWIYTNSILYFYSILYLDSVSQLWFVNQLV